MLTLVLDTSGDFCSFILAENQHIIWDKTQPEIRGHDRFLLPMIRDAFDQTHQRLKSLQRIVCVVGPGSFTGLRIGIAAAQGLCLSTGAVSQGISAFDVMQASAHMKKPALALIPTQTGQFYSQRFDTAHDEAPLVISLDQIKHQLSSDNLMIYASQPCSILEKANIPYAVIPITAHGAFIALSREVTIQPLLPFYLRESAPIRHLNT
jgi:tRNA threonylcarbamoyladenosine biosynthesis protein TsaB